MIIEKLKISQLKPAPYNPRKSDITQEANLKASLEKFGVVDPIIFNKQTGNIVGGHFRVRELKKLGVEEVDCVILDLSVEDEKELNIRLNANTGEWDMDVLEGWDKQDLEEWGLELEWEEETGGESKNDIKGNIEFSDELLLEHNYILFYFDNSFDFQVLKNKLNLQNVKSCIKTEKSQKIGVNRVLNGEILLNILNADNKTNV